MAVSPYEWNESIRQRNEYIEDKLKEGSPVIGVSYDNGILILCLRQTQRKIYEVYDKLAFSAIGNQADIETVRTGAIDIAHREGFTRSPDDVSVQRIVGFAVSPSIKKVYSDPFGAPIVMRALFAELGKTPAADQFFIVGYDGEFKSAHQIAVIAGTGYAEERATAHLAEELGGTVPNLAKALSASVHAWAIGRKHIEEEDREDGELPTDREGDGDISAFLAEHLTKGWVVEAAVLERNVSRENRYRLLSGDEVDATIDAYKRM
jgi:proteasome alpha subunit